MDSNAIAVGTYCDGRVVAWEIGTHPPRVIYEGSGSLTSLWPHLESQGRVVLILDELKGGRGVCMLLLTRGQNVGVGSGDAVGGDSSSDVDQ